MKFTNYNFSLSKLSMMMCDVILRRIATQQKQQQRQCNMKSGDSVMSYFYSDKDKLYKISKSTQNS